MRLKMPELPEVEVYRSYLAHTVLHKKIKSVDIYKPEILTFSPDKIAKLKGKSFEDTHRHGKYCFLKISSNVYLVLHFGMTGSIDYYRGEDDPSYSAVVFSFYEGHKFSVITKRKLGKIYLSSDIKEFIEQKNLGPDAYELGKKEFISILHGKKGKLKSALMDQSSIAGIGNIYSDEILYQSNLRPDKPVENLDDKAIRRIYAKMQSVLKTSIKHKTDFDKMPRNYLLHRRKPGSACGKCRGSIDKTEISGRSTYYCPQHQR